LQSNWIKNEKILRFFDGCYVNRLDGHQPQVLEIGCGSGDTTWDFILPSMSTKVKYLATDISQEMIEYASNTYKRDNLFYEIFDAGSREQTRDLVARHGKFDRVYSFFTMHWVKDLRKAFENVRLLLKDQGEFIFLFDTKNPMFGYVEKLSCDARFAPYAEKIQFRADFYDTDFVCSGKSPLELREFIYEFFGKLDIKLTTCEVKEIIFKFASRQYLVDFFSCVCPYYVELPENVKEDFRHSLEELIPDISTDTNVGDMMILHGVSRLS